MDDALRFKIADSLPQVALGSGIPRVIYQTMRSWDSLSLEMRSNVEKLKRQNPDWQYQFFSDEDCIDFIRSNYPPFIVDIYMTIRPQYGAARADLFRYLLLYMRGGFYLDIKSSASRPLTSILRETDMYILCQWSNLDGGVSGLHRELAAIPGGEFQQWHLAAAAGHPFLRAVLLQVLANILDYNPLRQGTGKLGVLRVTGPIAYSLAIWPLLGAERYRLESPESLGLEYSVVGHHPQQFQAHYADRSDAITELSLWWVAPAAVYSFLKRIRRWMRTFDRSG